MQRYHRIKSWEAWIILSTIGVFVVLLTVAAGHCDSIPAAGLVATNGSGGSFTFASGVLFASLADPGNITVSMSSRDGTLYVSSSALDIDGYLSHAFYNPSTGLLQATFNGRLSEDGLPVIAVHGVFYEQFNVSTRTPAWGTLRYGQAPEPSAWWMMATGLIPLARRLYGKFL